MPSHVNAFNSLKKRGKKTKTKCQTYKNQQLHFANIFYWIRGKKITGNLFFTATACVRDKTVISLSFLWCLCFSLSRTLPTIFFQSHSGLKSMFFIDHILNFTIIMAQSTFYNWFSRWKDGKLTGRSRQLAFWKQRKQIIKNVLINI